MVMSKIRSFIAIEIPEAIQQKIAKFSLMVSNPKTKGIRWVHPPNIHLTLRFLGDISPMDLDSLKSILFTIAGQYPVFNISIQDTGTFPSGNLPRVIWVGAISAPELFQLQQEIEVQLVKIGFESENHSFRPHITIGRISDHIHRDEITQLMVNLDRLQNKLFGSFSVNAIQLFRSELHPTGPIYSSLCSANLKPSDCSRGEF
jgi:2'-5' RNA ligase